MKKTFLVLLVALSGLLLTVQTASATSIASFAYNGHSYYLYAADPGTDGSIPGTNGLISWTDADAAATAAGGYLAVLTTFAETQAVYTGLIGNGFFTTTNLDPYRIQAWVGATTADGSSSTSNPLNWKWVTGEAWTAFDAANFAGSEPNGDSSGLTINRYGDSKWNDSPPGASAGGYIMEVPEGGATIAMLGLALTGLGLLRRKI